MILPSGYGNALKFNGTSQYARSANGVASSVTDNFTMMCWVKPISINGGSQSMFFDNGAKDARGMGLYMGTAGVFAADYAFVAAIDSGYTLVPGIWYHLALIRNSGTSQLYVNGIPKGSSSASTPNSGSDYITVGAAGNSDGSLTWYGNSMIRSVKFYERAISLGELRAQVANLPISKTSLKYHYEFREQLGTNVSDSSGNGLNLTTAASAPWVKSNLPVYTVYSRNLANSIAAAAGRLFRAPRLDGLGGVGQIQQNPGLNAL